MERRGQVQYAVNHAVARSYVTGWFEDPALAGGTRPRPIRHASTPTRPTTIPTAGRSSFPGLVNRTVTPTTPPRVDYGLTRQGRTLLEPITALAKWAEKNRATIQASRERFDGAASLEVPSRGRTG